MSLCFISNFLSFSGVVYHAASILQIMNCIKHSTSVLSLKHSAIGNCKESHRDRYGDFQMPPSPVPLHISVILFIKYICHILQVIIFDPIFWILTWFFSWFMVKFVAVIRFQILARTGTGGGPEGPPFFTLKEDISIIYSR